MSSTNYQIPVNYHQLLSVIRQLKAEDKVNLLKELQESTFKKRFKQLLTSLKNDELSMDDITKEVEAERSKRYE